MTTPRLGLIELIQNQSQPHVPVNATTRRLDAIVQAVVLDKDLTAPPGSAVDGDSYLVAGAGGSATGDWATHELELAYYWGGWLFVVPFNGMQVYVIDEDLEYRYSDLASPVGWAPDAGGGGASVDILFDQSVSATPGAAETDYDPTGWSGADGKNRLRITPNAGGTTINSLEASNAVDGQTVLVCNEDAAELLTLPNGAAGTAANTFEGPGAGDVVVLPKQCRLIVRVGARWRFT